MQVSVKVNMTGSWSVVLGSNPGLAQLYNINIGYPLIKG